MGNALVDVGVKFFSVYGATEFGPVTHFFRNIIPEETKLWDWVRFGPNSKIRWVPQDNDTYECQFLVSLSFILSAGVEHLFEDHPDASIVSGESPGYQGLCYIRYISQASNYRGPVEDVIRVVHFRTFSNVSVAAWEGSMMF
jgi:hypothetical protein